MKEHGLCYLATVYTKHADGIDAAFVEACEMTAKLVKRGCSVYSPIVHSHAVSIHGNIDPLDHGRWLQFNDAMLGASQTLIVAQMAGWEESVGVTYEIDYFTYRRKPILYLDIETLSLGPTPSPLARD